MWFQWTIIYVTNVAVGFPTIPILAQAAFRGQRSVTAAWATLIPWSISSYFFYIGMPKYWGNSLGSFPEVGQKQKTEKILQGFGLAQAAVTKRWLRKEEKTSESKKK